MVGRYGNFDYHRLTKTGFGLGVALVSPFLFGTALPLTG